MKQTYIPLRDSANGLRTMEEIEEDVIVHAIAFHNRNIFKASKALEIGRSTIYRKMRKFGIKLPSEDK